MRILKFLFVNYYFLSKKLGSNVARHSAKLYVSLLLFLTLFPWLTIIWYTLFNIEWLLYVLSMGLLAGICYAVFRHIDNRKFIQIAFKDYNNRTLISKICGTLIVILLPVVIPVFQFWLIKLMK